MVEDRLRVSRALAVDMESATVAANGFRYRIPTATLLAVSDKPLHAGPEAQRGRPRVLHRQPPPARRDRHRRGREGQALYPVGLPTADLRSPDEPLLGITGPEATPRTVEAAPRGPSYSQHQQSACLAAFSLCPPAVCGGSTMGAWSINRSLGAPRSPSSSCGTCGPTATAPARSRRTGRREAPAGRMLGAGGPGDREHQRHRSGRGVLPPVPAGGRVRGCAGFSDLPRDGHRD